MPAPITHRVSERRRERNLPLRTKVKTLVTSTRAAVQAGDAEEAEAKAKAAIVALDKAAQKGALHKGTAARRKSRLMKQLNSVKKS
ncbi:MAG: 30S ribosomal protein S20 [Chloroflexi bacterium]|nr:30S ribosomal protein S20 [Chloroflexota bacterium]